MNPAFPFGLSGTASQLQKMIWEEKPVRRCQAQSVRAVRWAETRLNKQQLPVAFTALFSLSSDPSAPAQPEPLSVLQSGFVL